MKLKTNAILCYIAFFHPPPPPPPRPRFDSFFSPPFSTLLLQPLRPLGDSHRSAQLFHVCSFILVFYGGGGGGNDTKICPLLSLRCPPRGSKRGPDFSPYFPVCFSRSRPGRIALNGAKRDIKSEFSPPQRRASPRAKLLQVSEREKRRWNPHLL